MFHFESFLRRGLVLIKKKIVEMLQLNLLIRVRVSTTHTIYAEYKHNI